MIYKNCCNRINFRFHFKHLFLVFIIFQYFPLQSIVWQCEFSVALSSIGIRNYYCKLIQYYLLLDFLQLLIFFSTFTEQIKIGLTEGNRNSLKRSSKPLKSGTSSSPSFSSIWKYFQWFYVLQTATKWFLWRVHTLQLYSRHNFSKEPKCIDSAIINSFVLKSIFFSNLSISK